jgi:hypothetical protein
MPQLRSKTSVRLIGVVEHQKKVARKPPVIRLVEAKARESRLRGFRGEGKHDRLPERMLLLGPQSVAFASDAIPGKHWVVEHQKKVARKPPVIRLVEAKARESRLRGFRYGGVLLLGPKSVAFASDAIPGKHWVVQVSHNPTADDYGVTSKCDRLGP